MTAVEPLDRDAALAAAQQIARVAEEVGGVSGRLTSVGRRLGPSVWRAPRTGTRAALSLLRARTSRRGLGLPHRVGALLGQEGLAVQLAVTSLRLRIAAVAQSHPEIYEDGDLRSLIDALSSDRSVRAAGIVRRLIKEQGAEDTLGRLAPILSELLALHALLDENPANDASGWSIATGTALQGEALVGLSVDALARWDTGGGHVEPVELAPSEHAKMSDEGTIVGFLRNLGIVGNTGRVLLQTMRGPADVERYVLMVPGMQAGMPRNDSPQDLVGAWRNTMLHESPYTRAAAKALAAYGVPEGADLAIIGHSEGGAVAMNLAADLELTRRHRITHVVVVGAPVDFKRPADPTTWVATIANQHDLVPSLDGQGPGSPFHLHPDWYVVDYADAHHAFPACHNIRRYQENLEHDLPEARAHIDEQLRPFRGTLVRRQAYMLWDDVRQPEGFPFFTTPVSEATTSQGRVELPVRCYQGRAAVLFFGAPVGAAASLLAASGLRPALLGRRRAVVAVLARQLRRTSFGAFNDLTVALLVHDPWRTRPVAVWTDLFRRVDRRGSGAFVVASAATSRQVEAARRELWGQPSCTAKIDVTVAREALAVTVQAPDDRDRLVTLAGPLGRWFPGPEMDLVLYSRLGDDLLRASVDTDGAMRTHLAPRARLHLAPSDHPLPRTLTALGLNGARPFLALSHHHYRARLTAGATLPLPGS